MRWMLFGFPDESPHAIPGPDDFCITEMMWPRLMELSMSGGIRHESKNGLQTQSVPPTQSNAQGNVRKDWKPMWEEKNEH